MLRENKIWGDILVLPFIPPFPTFSATWLNGIYNANKYLKRKDCNAIFASSAFSKTD